MESEDRVEFWLYPTRLDLDPVELLAECWNLVRELVAGYIWQYQPFALRLQTNKDGWCLRGSVLYGESVEDEWMAVGLLRHITLHLSTLAGRITDSDGEILLIEAADWIPRWAAEPAAAEGRVFLYRGQVHLIPVAKSPGSVTPLPAGCPDPWDGAAVVAAYPELSIASQKIQQAIVSRLNGYPQQVDHNHHTVGVRLPPLVAALLHQDGQAVSELVLALRDRDPIDLRRSRAMTRLPQAGSVAYALRFPRCLYAMLSSINLRPHRASGWSIDEKKKAEVLGFKLSLGLEMLLSRNLPSSTAADTDQPALPVGPAWAAYLTRLAALGYFQDELEGSARYRELAAQAAQFWQRDTSAEEEEGCTRLDRLLALVRRLQTDDSLTGRPSKGWLPPAPDKDDDESWLEVTPESLDRMLAARFGVPSEAGREDQIPAEVNRFLSQMSDMAGVGGDDEHDLEFNPTDLVASMRKLLGDMGGGDAEGSQSEEDNSDSERDIEDDEGIEDPVTRDYMDLLDSEVGAGVAGRRTDVADPSQPLVVDSGLLANLLASYSAQMDMNGPAANILNSIRINPGQKQKKNK